MEVLHAEEAHSNGSGRKKNTIIITGILRTGQLRLYRVVAAGTFQPAPQAGDAQLSMLKSHVGRWLLPIARRANVTLTTGKFDLLECGLVPLT